MFVVWGSKQVPDALNGPQFEIELFNNRHKLTILFDLYILKEIFTHI